MKPATRTPRIQLGSALLMLGGLLLFVLVAISSYQTLRATEQATRLRAQARESLLTSGRVLSLLKDVETGQRGYILTGNAVYLGPYEAGYAEAMLAFIRLTQELANLPAMFGPLHGLQDMIELRLDQARRNVEARKQKGFDTAQKLILSDEGRLTMDAIRLRFAELERLQRQEIDRRNREVTILKRWAFWVNGALTFLGILLIGGSYILLLREHKCRVRAEQALLDANTHLETAVAHRTAELELARSEIEAFALRLDRGIEAERRRLAREVHDQLGQIFTALKMTLTQAFNKSPDQTGSIERMNSLLSDGIATARRIAAELRPPLLDDLGLSAALAHRAQRFAEETGVACETAVQQDERLHPEQATQLFRIVQEALTNVARHAGASRVRIEGTIADGQYWLAVEDNGRGMSDSMKTSLGLLSMRERAALAGGKLELGPGREGGLRVFVQLPLNHPLNH